MGVVWLDAETVEQLKQVALESRLPLKEGVGHALNPGSDLEGALNRPRGHYNYWSVRSL